MQTRMKNLHCELRKIQKQRARLKQIVEAVVDKHGIIIDDEIHNDLKQIIKTENSELFNTFQKVFWQQQVHAAFKDDARGMRWHPLMIKWCIYLRHQSQGAYETLRHSKCISLPSQRTLRDYTHHIKPTPGFSADVDVQLYSAAKLHQCEGREKYVILIIDEMHVKEDLVFDKHSGELIGFTNIGEINSQLLALEQSLNNETHPIDIPLASSMMTFMVRGLFSHLQFPYAYFPCRNVTGDLLFDPLWEAVCRLERSGFKVMGTTSDGASINRRLIRLHNHKNELIHKVPNPYAVDGRDFFFFSDPPHLIKTTRNCWFSNSRTLWKNGREISWNHLKQLYGKNRSETGLVLLPRLKYEHVQLTSFSKMRVDLAAQAKETAVFTDIFDKFFDALNVCNFTDGKHQRKPFTNPYRSGTDFRLKWLEETFLPYLDEWEASVRKRESFSNAQKKIMLLSQETLDGLKMTTYSFVELVRYLFQVPGVNVFFSRRLCQDPLEKFFGCQRQMGGTHDNPTVKEFQQNTQALRVVNSFCRDVVKGNCRDPSETLHKAIMKIIHDESFRVPSPEAATALETAQSMIAWATPTYPQLFCDFSLDLVTNLRSCFTSRKNCQKERELMWGNYHRLRCTPEFYIKWRDFMLTSIKCKPSPTFYQYITYEVFINEINTMYESLEGNPSTQTSLEMTKIEENALRYVAGYVCRRTRINLETSTHPHKDEMIFCILT